MPDINTVLADILTAQNDAYAVAGTPSLSAQLATAQAEGHDADRAGHGPPSRDRASQD